MLQSWLPEGGTNLFQQIKAWRQQSQDAGRQILNLSIGQPSGPALFSARKAAAEAVMSEAETMHKYQDNDSPGVEGFAQRFVQALVKQDLSQEAVGYLPIPGIKPMLGLVPLACGSFLSDWPSGFRMVLTTNPGYPTPRDWSDYLDRHILEPTLNPENQFRFSTAELEPPFQLIMMNYPHNPSGQTASRRWLERLCAYCQEWDVRLFNDAAYHPLAHKRTSCTLTEVAVNYPGLSWAEAFSASKVIGNGTGWRVGAIVGSPDFVGDIATIKGNTDSGFVAFAAAGVIHAVENDQEGIRQCRITYERRLMVLIDLLDNHGMRLAVRPGAGFFTLWRVPKRAFGEEIGDAEHFNQLMIRRTGVVGVHFNPSYIRYAVVGDVEAMLPDLDEAFAEADVSYE